MHDHQAVSLHLSLENFLSYSNQIHVKMEVVFNGRSNGTVADTVTVSQLALLTWDRHMITRELEGQRRSCHTAVQLYLELKRDNV